MAGLLVGAGGPSALAGVATGASVLPIRVAGWQPDSLGHYAIYARSDQIIAGLERAVDPNDDGDAHDAARIALVALAEPFAAFADGPEARAAAGALALDTLVVAPAGNDGLAAAGYGDVSAPGGAPAALTVGALDARTQDDRVRVVLRAGLARCSTTPRRSPAPCGRRTGSISNVAVPRGTIRGTRRTAPRLTDFFTRSGVSIVAGRAALVPVGASPAPAAMRAAAAGASVVLLYGSGAALPAGGLGLDESIPVPVVSISTGAARAALQRIARGERVVVRVTRGRKRAERRAGPRRELLLVGPRVRRAREAGPRRARRRARDVGPRRERGRLAALRHRERIERGGRNRRGRSGLARAGAAVARRERARAACSSARRTSCRPTR